MRARSDDCPGLMRATTPYARPTVSKNAKEQKEVYQGKVLLERIGVLDATVTKNSTPEPDILAVTRDGKRYGIELTSVDLAAGDQSHAIQPSLDGLCKKAAAIHLASGIPRRHVTFTWAMGVGPMPKKMGDELAIELCRIAESIELQAGQVARYTPHSGDHPFIRSGILSITTTLCEESRPQPGWYCQYSAGFTYAPLSWVESSLERKKGKPQHYVRKYDEIWLVVHSGWEAIFTERLMTDKITSHEFTSPYDRLYYMPVMDDLVQLKLKRPSEAP